MKRNRDDRDADALMLIIRYCDNTENARTRFGDTFDAFSKDNDYQSSCTMYVYQICEICNRISGELKAKYPNVPWQKIRGMRNIFAHEYENVQTGRLWEAMTNYLPGLREDCLSMLQSIGLEYMSEPEDDALVIDGEDDWEPEL
ncbi:MAG: DUF86 domain-containing protein [Oscillospiraceae bacterium]|jgi:uncharacterized protein with HEPN domain|nr:DUF86 domain-containing protein [Oscillospiraceae bacterium]